MLVSQIITRLREDYLDDTLGVETNDSLVSEASLIRFAEEAEIQACRRTDFIYDESTTSICNITIVDGQNNYSIDSNITRIERVSINGTDLIHTTEEALQNKNPAWRQTINQAPTHYYMRGRTIYLYPTPGTTTASYTLDLAVYRLPVNAITKISDSFEVMEEAQDDLIYWMLYRVYNLRDEDLFDPDKAASYLGMFTEVYGEVVPLDVRIHQFEYPKILQHDMPDGYSYTAKGHLEDDDFDKRGW